jgi:hypothetical protein
VVLAGIDRDGQDLLAELERRAVESHGRARGVADDA